jgi:FAD:protein FMN transferase
MLHAAVDSRFNTSLPSGLDLHRLNKLWHARLNAMGRLCEVFIDTHDEAAAITAAIAVSSELWRLESKYSCAVAGNVVDAINAAAGGSVKVDEETERLLDLAARLYQTSDGLYDITSRVLSHVWHFDSDNEVPNAASIADASEFAGWHHVQWVAPYLRMPVGIKIDVCGLVKDYAIDCAAHSASRVSGAPLLVEFGGDIVATGSRSDGTPWKVIIGGASAEQSPHVIELRDGGIVTSGYAQRAPEKPGAGYSHISGPRGGLSASDTPLSVTVLESSCSQAGALSILAILQGRNADQFLRERMVAHWFEAPLISGA